VQRSCVGFGEAARYRQAEARPAVPATWRARTVERLEYPLQLGRRYPRTAIDDPYDHAVAPRPLPICVRHASILRREALPASAGEAAHGTRPHRHRVPTGVAPRVLQDVDKRPLKLHGVHSHQGQVAIDRQRELPRARAQLEDRRTDQLIDRDPLSARLGRACFQA